MLLVNSAIVPDNDPKEYVIVSRNDELARLIDIVVAASIFAFVAEIDDTLGILSSVTSPEHDVDSRVVFRMLPLPEILIDFVPSELCEIVREYESALTQLVDIVNHPE